MMKTEKNFKPIEGFINDTAQAIFKFTPHDQNLIIKQILLDLRDNRKELIQQGVEEMDSLKQLTNELPK